MANPPCMSDDGNAAVFTGTNFDTGQSVMLCGPCLVSFCATIVEGMTGLPVSALLDSVDQLATGDDDAGEIATDETTTDEIEPDPADPADEILEDSPAVDNQ